METRYTLHNPIGYGGFSTVYRATDTWSQTDVVIKVLNPEHRRAEDIVQQFRNEAEILSTLVHPNIITMLDYWEDDKGCYLVMPCMEGGDLLTFCEHETLTLEEVGGVLYQVGEALDYGHGCGIIHSDVKPQNILLDENGLVVLTDYGIALNKNQPSGDKRSDNLFATFAYVAPEQITLKTVLPQSDVYSVGIMLYELLAGELPFQDANALDLLKKHVFSPMPSVRLLRPNLPSQVDLVIQKATHKRPEMRYQSVVALAETFQSAITGFHSMRTGQGTQRAPITQGLYGQTEAFAS